MYVLIAIIFIAELIIAGFLINLILRADMKIKDIDKKIVSVSPEIIDGIRKMRKGALTLKTAIEKGITFINRKRYEFWQRVVNLVVIYIILFVLKIKFKKAASICQYAVILKDCWDSIPG